MASVCALCHMHEVLNYEANGSKVSSPGCGFEKPLFQVAYYGDNSMVIYDWDSLWKQVDVIISI